MAVFPGTLNFGDVYPGLATMKNPMPDRATTDETSSARALEGAPKSSADKYPAIALIGMMVALFVLRFSFGGE